MPSPVEKIQVTIGIDPQCIANLLTHAFDGGSDWCSIHANVEPELWTFEGDGPTPEHYDEYYPLNKGGATLISSDLDYEKYGIMRLDYEAIQRGIQIMAEKEPYQFYRMQSRNDDAGTGDTFLQCCLFGETIYG